MTTERKASVARIRLSEPLPADYDGELISLEDFLPEWDDEFPTYRLVSVSEDRMTIDVEPRP